MIVSPSGLQLPPRPSLTVHSGKAAPPLASIFFRALSAKKAIHRLSGDQNGYVAPSVPDRGWATVLSSDRSHNCPGLPGDAAPNTIFLPSGEISGGAPAPLAIP